MPADRSTRELEMGCGGSRSRAFTPVGQMATYASEPQSAEKASNWQSRQETVQTNAHIEGNKTSAEIQSASTVVISESGSRSQESSVDSKEGTFKEPDLRDKERAAIKIQAHYKGYHARKEYTNHLNTTNAVAETLLQRHRESIEIRVQLFESPTALPKATTILLTPEAALETLREGAVQKQQPRTATRESSSSSLQQTADRCLLAQETEQEREEDAARLPRMAAKSLQPAEEEGVGQTSSREQNTNTNANLGGRVPSPSDVLVSEWDQLPEILSSGPASEEDGDANCKKDESNGDQQSEETVSLGEARAKGDVVGDRSWNSGVQCNGDSSKGDSDAVSNGDQQCENSLLPGNTGDALVNGEVTEDRSETAVEDKIQSIGGASQLGGDNGGSDAASIVEGSNKDGTQDQSDDDTIRSETAAVLNQEEHYYIIQ